MGLSEREQLYALNYLHHLFPGMRNATREATDTEVLAALEAREEKAAGAPWCWRGAPHKGQALKKYGLAQLEEYYKGDVSLIGSTLKDELRPTGKDARLFRPQDVSSYVEGCRLFYSQNEYLTETFASPVFVKFVVPGHDLGTMFNTLRQLKGDNYAADGSQWDAHFPLGVAQIIARFRSQRFDDRIQRYYSQMYNGWTVVGANVINLVGQPSGHYNTSVDNCLGHIIGFAVHAYRRGLVYEDLDTFVVYYCCGDDLIWSTKLTCFAPAELEDTYNSLGMYLEFESYETQPIEALTFVGVKSVTYERGGVQMAMFKLVSQRAVASLNIHRKSATTVDILSKYASLAILWFCDLEKYELAVGKFYAFLDEQVRSHHISRQDQRVIGLERLLNRERIFLMYADYESSRRLLLPLEIELFENCTGSLKERCLKHCARSLVQGRRYSERRPQGQTGV